MHDRPTGDDDATPPRPSSLAILDALTDLDELRREARRDRASESALMALLRRGNRWDRELAVRCYTATPAVLAIGARDRRREVRKAVAGRSNTPVDIQVELARDVSREVLEELTGNYWLSDAARSELVQHWYPAARRLGHEALSPEAVESLVSNRWESIRMVAARRSDLTVEQAMRLAEGRSDDVRLVLAWNTDRPEVLLAVLERLPDQHHPARDPLTRAVARNAATPVEALERLVGDPDDLTRRFIATRSNLPDHLRDRLAVDERPSVRAEIAARTRCAELVDQLAGDRSAHVRRVVARRDDLDPAIVARLVADRAPTVRVAVIEHQSLSTVRLVELAVDRAVAVRTAARRALDERGRPVVPMFTTEDSPEAQASLLAWAEVTDDVDLLMAAVDDSSLPLFIRRLTLRRPIADTALRHARVDRATASTDPEIRADVVRHHRMTPERLAALACDTDGRVRLAVVRHRFTTDEMLKPLTKDRRPGVAKAAKAELALRRRSRTPRPRRVR
ncbi:MAG: hypothetical protein RLZZ01_2451 [Actinomycetota bacterium]